MKGFYFVSFGDALTRRATGAVLLRAENLEELQKKIFEVPEVQHTWRIYPYAVPENGEEVKELKIGRFYRPAELNKLGYSKK